MDIPDASEAETMLAACAIAFDVVPEDLDLEDVRDPNLRRIVVAVGDPGIHAEPGPDETPLDARCRAIGALTGLSPAWLHELADEWGCLGRLHLLVPAIAEAARQREVQRLAYELLERPESARDLASRLSELLAGAA